jgi:hypothetical protein
VTDDIVLPAWAAGLFEGEGCFKAQRRRGSFGLSAALASTDEDVIRMFHRIVGVGNVNGPYRLKEARRKPLWRWQASGTDVECVYRLLEPWLHSRRRARYAELLAERRAYERRLPEIISARGRAGGLVTAARRRAWQKERLF